MSWSSLEAMQYNTSPSIFENSDNRRLGNPDLKGLFAAKSLLGETSLWGGVQSSVSAVGYTDANLERKVHDGQAPDQDGHILCQECGLLNLTGLDDNSFGDLAKGCLCTWICSMEAMLELEQECDSNQPSLEQRQLENLLLPGDEQDNQQQLFRDYAANLQFEQSQTNSPLGYQVAKTMPFTNSVLVSAESSKSGVLNSDDLPKKHPAYAQSSESGSKSMFQQLHADFFPNNGTSTAAANIWNHAVANSGSLCFEDLPGFSNGVQAEQNFIPASLQKDIKENLLALVSVAQRHGLPERRRRAERLPEVIKTQPSWQLLSVALASSCNDREESGAQSDLPPILIGANTDVCNNQHPQQSEPLFPGSRSKGDRCHGFSDANRLDLTFVMENARKKEVFEQSDNEIPAVTPLVYSNGINPSAVCSNSRWLDSSSPNESRKIEVGAPMSDHMVSPSASDHTWLEIAEPRSDVLSGPLQLNASPVVPIPTPNGQIQQAQELGSRARLPQFASTSFNNEVNNDLLYQWEQIARRRRKCSLPPAAWGG